MPPVETGPPAHALRDELTRCQRLRKALAGDPDLARVCELLGAWQRERFARTYRDLLASERYRPATEFFLDDVYAAKDLSERDRDIARILPIMTRVLPSAAIATLATAVEMDALTQQLDVDLARALMANEVSQIGLQDYLEAYRRCDNYQQRERQIRLVGRLGRELGGIVTSRFIYTALRMVRGPARAAGLGDLQRLFERGFEAFRRMGDATPFVQTIVTRETQILERIFARHPDPFGLG